MEKAVDREADVKKKMDEVFQQVEAQKGTAIQSAFATFIESKHYKKGYICRGQYLVD